jgi:hypothetical protein
MWFDVVKRKVLSKGRFGITIEDDYGNPFVPEQGKILTSGGESFVVQVRRPEDGDYVSVKSNNNKFPGKRICIG